MDQVARKARLSRALLYVYFKDKQDLLFGLCERALGVLTQRFTDAVAASKRGLDQMAGDRPRLRRVFAGISGVFRGRGALRAAHAGAREVETQRRRGHAPRAIRPRADGRRHRGGHRDGSIRPDVGDPKVVSTALWGFMHGVLQLASTKANVLRA